MLSSFLSWCAIFDICLYLMKGTPEKAKTKERIHKREKRKGKKTGFGN